MKTTTDAADDGKMMKTPSSGSCFPGAEGVTDSSLDLVGRKVESCAARPESARTEQRIATAKAAGFTSRDIIDAVKDGQLEALWALVEEKVT